MALLSFDSSIYIQKTIKLSFFFSECMSLHELFVVLMV